MRWQSTRGGGVTYAPRARRGRTAARGGGLVAAARFQKADLAVQRLTGVDTAVRQQARANPGAQNQLSVLQELQADCFAGVWGHSTGERNLPEPGDIEEALTAASAVGDDRLQQRATGGSTRRPGRTARPHSGRSGSTGALRAATRATATPSRR